VTFIATKVYQHQQVLFFLKDDNDRAINNHDGNMGDQTGCGQDERGRVVKKSMVGWGRAIFPLHLLFFSFLNFGFWPNKQAW
jgi:hypothetical protein